VSGARPARAVLLAWLLAGLLACDAESGDDGLVLRPEGGGVDAAMPADEAMRDARTPATPIPAHDAGCASAPHDPGELDPARTAIVPLPAGEGLLDQCSRPTLTRVDGFWTPTEADVDALEAALPAYFGGECQPHYFIVLNEYYAQYVGVESGARSLIYGNFVHQNAFVSRADAGLAQEPYVLCDGGSLAWGIAYDVANGAFEALAVNGSVEEL
jgi:hypothetical protein